MNTDWIQACAALVDEDRVTMRSIAAEVCRKHGTTLRELRNGCTMKPICLARWEAFWRCHAELGKGPTEIGRFFNRDHATVLYGIKRHLGMSPNEAMYRGKVAA